MPNLIDPLRATVQAIGQRSSRGGEGYAQAGHEPVVTRTQRKRLMRWSQKALDVGSATCRAAGSHPPGIPAELTTLRSPSNWDQERSNPGRALRQRVGVGANCKASGGGFLKKQRPGVTLRIGRREDGDVEVIGRSRAEEALEPACKREGAMPSDGKAPNCR